MMVVGLLRIRPHSRDEILHRWIGFCAWTTLNLVARRIGGARLGPLPALDGQPAMLILMNHQSVLDILIAFLSV